MEILQTEITQTDKNTVSEEIMLSFPRFNVPFDIYIVASAYQIDFFLAIAGTETHNFIFGEFNKYSEKVHH